MTWLEARLGLARGPAQFETWLIAAWGSGHLDSAWQNSARLGSAWLATRGSAQLGSWLMLGSAGNLSRAQLWLNLVLNSGITTQDSAWLGSGLSSAYLHQSSARLVLARLISARKFLSSKQFTDERSTYNIKRQEEVTRRGGWGKLAVFFI